jgi:hypothetical protein
VPHRLGHRSLPAFQGPICCDWFRFEIGPGGTVTDGASGIRLPVIAYIGATQWCAFRVDLVGADLRMTGEPEDVPPLARGAIPDVEQHGYRVYPLVDHIADKVAAILQRYGEKRMPSTRYKDLVHLVAIVTEASVASDLSVGWPAHARSKRRSASAAARTRRSHVWCGRGVRKLDLPANPQGSATRVEAFKGLRFDWRSAPGEGTLPRAVWGRGAIIAAVLVLWIAMTVAWGWAAGMDFGFVVAIALVRMAGVILGGPLIQQAGRSYYERQLRGRRRAP